MISIMKSLLAPALKSIYAINSSNVKDRSREHEFLNENESYISNDKATVGRRISIV